MNTFSAFYDMRLGKYFGFEQVASGLFKLGNCLLYIESFVFIFVIKVFN